MSENIMEKLQELQIYLRNDIQEILICKHEETEELFLVNTIYEAKVLEGVDLEQLQKDIIGIEKVDNTDEGIRLLTKYSFYPSLKDAINDEEKEIPLEKQMSYANFIINRLLKLKHLPLALLDPLFNENHLIVDNNGDLQMLGSIIINPDFQNLALQEIFNKLADVLHIIFSGKEIIDGEIDENIPPDIRKIITNCTNNHYFKYEDLASDFKGSSVYKLMNPESEEGYRVHLIRKNLKTKKKFHNLKKNSIKIAILLIVLLPLFVYAGSKILDLKNNNTDESSFNGNNDIDNNNDNEGDSSNDDNIVDNGEDDEDDNDDIIDEDLTQFYNDKLFDLGSNDNIGVLDDSKYYKGSHSVRVSNDTDMPRTILVGVIDLNEDGFSFLKNRKSIDVSMWLNSDRNLDGIVTLKLIGRNNRILSQASDEVYVHASMWTLHSLGVNTTNGNYIKIYLTLKDEGNAWIDSIQAEILK